MEKDDGEDVLDGSEASPAGPGLGSGDGEGVGDADADPDDGGAEIELERIAERLSRLEATLIEAIAQAVAHDEQGRQSVGQRLAVAVVRKRLSVDRRPLPRRRRRRGSR